MIIDIDLNIDQTSLISEGAWGFSGSTKLPTPGLTF
jgi:hypothetical protein